MRSRNGGKKTSALCGMTSQGNIKGHKRQKINLEGPKKDFKSVQEKEEELMESVDVQYHSSLSELVRDSEIFSLNLFQRAVPHPRTLSM